MVVPSRFSPSWEEQESFQARMRTLHSSLFTPVDQIADFCGLGNAAGREPQVPQTSALQSLGFFALRRRAALLGVADIDRGDRGELFGADDDVDAHPGQRMIRMQFERVP